MPSVASPSVCGYADDNQYDNRNRKPKGKRTKPAKPAKPYPDFPLTAHANGQWCKKVRGKVHFFGVWSDPDAALAKYLDERDDLQAGRVPQRASGSLTVGDMANLYLEDQLQRAEAGEIRFRTWRERRDIGRQMIDLLGRNTPVESLRSSDFSRMRNRLAKMYAPTGLKGILIRMRGMFKWAWDCDLIDKPVKYGPGMKAPSAKSIRAARNAKPEKFIEAYDVRRLIDTARQPLKAMILLGINGAMGNRDVAWLKPDHIRDGWIVYPRPKTETPRRFPLWTETQEALEDALRIRKPSDLEYYFVTVRGNPWAWENEHGHFNDEVGKQFKKHARTLGIDAGFYHLRHTFRTVADETLDIPAIELVMGHAGDPRDMGDTYRERVSDERLERVTDHVRQWLFPPADEGEHGLRIVG